MTGTGNEAIVSESEVAPLCTRMPHLATATTSQEIPATPIIAQTLLLLSLNINYPQTATANTR